MPSTIHRQTVTRRSRLQGDGDYGVASRRDIVFGRNGRDALSQPSVYQSGCLPFVCRENRLVQCLPAMTGGGATLCSTLEQGTFTFFVPSRAFKNR